MTPICITAHLATRAILPLEGQAIDSVLIWARCQELQLPDWPIVEVDVPIEKEAAGRFWLASFAEVLDMHGHQVVRYSRAFPTHEYNLFGDGALNRIQGNLADFKPWLIPRETVRADALRWWAIGDADGCRSLLRLVSHVGKKVSIGHGKIIRWDVETCEAWDGFPVLRDGMPTRPLPTDWPGLSDGAPVALRSLAPPYWDHTKEEPCAIPL